MPDFILPSVRYRHEWKYLCSQAQLDALQYRLRTVMKQDAHQDGRAFYHIRSLYFDDSLNHGLRENAGGLDRRRKFRLRIYDRCSDIIHLEIKYKVRGMTRKESCTISLSLCELLIRGNALPFNENYPAPLKQLYLEMQTRRMRPVIIVEYERTAFIEPAGNVRITFDRNIAASDRIDSFLSENTLSAPVLEPGQHILEVKFDRFLPASIRSLADTGQLNRTAFSKYYICRTKYQRGIQAL